MSELRRLAERGGLTAFAAPWRSAVAELGRDRYSRRVQLLKYLLPAIGLSLLLLVASWPRLRPLLESVRLGLPAIDLRDARELQMVHPRYAGLDRHDRPYVVTARTGHQVPDRDDLMALDSPRADMTLAHGATAVLTAATGVYQSQAQLLDLFRDVTLIHQDGTRFVTKTAHLDLANNTAKGDDPVAGHGPSGDIAAAGFRILSRGDRIIFTGHTDLVLKGVGRAARSAAPPELPKTITTTASALEAAALDERRPGTGGKASPAVAARPQPAAAKNDRR